MRVVFSPDTGFPPEEVVEMAYLPSGRIVVMTKDDSYWFEKDGTSIKGSHLEGRKEWREIKRRS